jgi:hypothetical protein
MTFRFALTFDAEYPDRPTEFLGLDALGVVGSATAGRLRAALVEGAIVRMGAGA